MSIFNSNVEPFEEEAFDSLQEEGFDPLEKESFDFFEEEGGENEAILVDEFEENTSLTVDWEESILRGLKGGIPSLKKEKDLKKIKSVSVQASVDTEYTNDKTLSIQGRFRLSHQNEEIDFEIIVIDKAYKQYYDFDSPEAINFNSQIRNETHIFFDDLSYQGESYYLYYFQEVLGILCPELSDSEGDSKTYYFTQYLYYQIKDLTIAFGRDQMLPIYKNIKSKIYQRRGISGKFSLQHSHRSILSTYHFYLKDLCTVTTARGLKGLILRFYGENSTTNSNLKIKEFFDIHKKEMDKWTWVYKNILMTLFFVVRTSL